MKFEAEFKEPDGFRDTASRIHDALFKKATAYALLLESHIKADKLSGQVLNVRTGNLRRSIFSGVDDNGDTIEIWAKQSGDVKYGAIHEFGGKTAAHDILPMKAKALHFIVGGKEIFAKIVHHPGSVMPERSYMRSSLEDMKDSIIAGLKDAVVKEFAK